MRKDLSFKPLTGERWSDFEQLFGANGACGGCWCMLWRLSRKNFEQRKGESNKRAMQALVESGVQPGILAYHHGVAIGWCAVAPREHYTALFRSRILRPVDARNCWSIACLFVERQYRKQGISTTLLSRVAEFARSQGAELLEGYPVEAKAGTMIPAAFAWTGLSKSFIDAGFTEVARRSPTRPIMRLELG